MKNSTTWLALGVVILGGIELIALSLTGASLEAALIGALSVYFVGFGIIVVRELAKIRALLEQDLDHVLDEPVDRAGVPVLPPEGG